MATYSHIGMKENALADKLANSATANSHVEVDVGLEVSEAYNLVDNYIINKWQQTWDSIPTGSHYTTIEKTVSTKIKYLNASRQKEVVITRLRLRKCKLNAYLHQTGKHPDGLIAVCSCSFYFNSVIVQTAGQILTSNIAKKRASARIALFRVVEQRTNQCMKLVSL